MKRIILCGIAVVLLGLLLWSPAPAIELRVQSRAKVWDLYWNTGVQGVRQEEAMSWYRPLGMSYPGYMWVQYPKEFINYWGARDWGVTGWITWYNELNGTMPGFWLTNPTANGPSSDEYPGSDLTPRTDAASINATRGNDLWWIPQTRLSPSCSRVSFAGNGINRPFGSLGCRALSRRSDESASRPYSRRRAPPAVIVELRRRPLLPLQRPRTRVQDLRRPPEPVEFPPQAR